ncbi:MAG: ComEC/Rec2 family competence protein [Chlamydiota bacterium]
MNFLKDFWRRFPALHVGLSLTLGTAAALGLTWELIFPTLLLSLRYNLALRATILALIAFSYTSWQYPQTHFQEKKLEGIATFHIENLKIQPSPFHKSYLYKGKITKFISEETTLYHLPCSIYIPFKKNRPQADHDYQIKGTLVRTGNYHYVLKPNKKEPWLPLQNQLNLTEWRFRAKESVKNFLKKEIPDTKSAAFLTALATGNIDERSLALEFNKLGIQHILAISGFHFALIAAFLSFFFKWFLSPKNAAILLLCVLSAYFLFIGNAPSVLRAWIAISLFLISQIFRLQISGLNALGVALSAEILCDPLLATSMGFQLSFLATLAILLIYPLMNKLTYHLLPRRPLETVTMMNKLHQHLYLVGAALRHCLSLNIAVHLTTIPVILFLFHKFPLLSLGYNLFFPLGASIALLLLVTSLLFNLIFPPLGHLLHKLNSTFTATLLKSTEHPPSLLNFTLHLPAFPLIILIAFLTLLFYIGIYAESRREQTIC